MSVGAILNSKYRLETVIGSGGMGCVYEATHLEIGRKVAIKQLRRKYEKDERALLRFKREAKVAGTLGHDNICEVTDLGTTEEGVSYLVMPLLKGVSMARLIRERESLSLVRVCDILGQTLDALKAAHSAGIVHRDMKPDNIYVSKFGDREDFVKILDFGISKLMDPASDQSLTDSASVPGTPLYMAPEQAGGREDIDHRIDIYATGVILYEALTGRRPYNGSSYNEVLRKILTTPFPKPRSLKPSIPQVLEGVVLKAMARDPEERFQDALEMKQALESALNSILTSGEREANLADLASIVTDTADSRSAHTPFNETEIDEHLQDWRSESIVRSSGFRPVAVIASLIIFCGVGGYFWLEYELGSDTRKATYREVEVTDEVSSSSLKSGNAREMHPSREDAIGEEFSAPRAIESIGDGSKKHDRGQRKKRRAKKVKKTEVKENTKRAEEPLVIEGRSRTSFVLEYGD